MSKNLTKPQAMAAYRRICSNLGYQAHTEPVVQGHGNYALCDSGPLLYRDYDDRYRWAVVFEGDYDWTMRAWPAENNNPQGVFSEPINGYSLALYPREYW